MPCSAGRSHECVSNIDPLLRIFVRKQSNLRLVTSFQSQFEDFRTSFERKEACFNSSLLRSQVLALSLLGFRLVETIAVLNASLASLLQHQ